MQTIIKILGSKKREKDGKEYLIVKAVTEDAWGNQQECSIYIGGDCETWIQGQVIKAHVKRAQSRKHA